MLSLVTLIVSLYVVIHLLTFICVQDQYSFVHDALVEFIRSGGETEVKDVNVAQYVRQLTTPADNGNTPLHTQYQVLIHIVFRLTTMSYHEIVCNV